MALPARYVKALLNNPEAERAYKPAGWNQYGLRVTLERFKGTKHGVLKKPLNFPIAPLESFAWTQGISYSDFQTLARGQFSRAAGRELITFDMRTLVVDYQPHWASRHSPRPDAPMPGEIAKVLKNIAQVQSPVMFVARSGFWSGNDLRIPVTLRSLSVEERGGEVDARYFDLSFAEWREQELDRKGFSGSKERFTLPVTVSIKKTGQAFEVGSAVGPEGEGAQPVTGTPGNLHELAQHYYGDPTLWKAISLQNGIGDFAPSRGLDQLEKAGKQIRKLKIPRLVDKRTGGVEYPGH